MGQMKRMAITSGTIQTYLLLVLVTVTNKPWGGFVRGIKQNIHVCHFLQICCLLYVWNCSSVVTNASKNCSLLIKYCWTYIVLWWQHNISWTDICGSTFMAPWSWIVITCLNLSVLSANEKIFLREIMTYEGGTHLLMKLHTWVEDLQLSSSFLQVLIFQWMGRQCSQQMYCYGSPKCLSFFTEYNV